MSMLANAGSRPWNSPRARALNSHGARLRLGMIISTVLLVSQPARGEYRVQQGDTIEISVAGLPELRQKTTVQSDGAIAFPLIGSLPVQGLTPAELRTEAQKQLARKIYRLHAPDGREILTVIQPDEVSAAIVGYRPVYVTGDVAKPGEQTFVPEMTVRQALALAGGAELSQARFPRSSNDLSSLMRDRGISLEELAEATAKVARVAAELNGQSDLADLDFSDLPLPKAKLAEIQNTETAILQARVADYKRERDFFKAAVDQSDERIAVVQKQQAEEEEGSRADTVELKRLVELLSKGQETNPRVTEARRALLLSSTRALQVSVELLELKRQRTESEHQAQHFEDDRRIGLLKELQDAAGAKASSRIKFEALESELKIISGSPMPGSLEENMLRTVQVARRTHGASEKSIVDDDFVLMPGDVISVSLHVTDWSAQAER
jgi:polysaccharide biosynthesis/export protein